MKSKDAILLSKLGTKGYRGMEITKPAAYEPSDITTTVTGPVGTIPTVKSAPIGNIPTVKSGPIGDLATTTSGVSSLGLLKAHKMTAGKNISANTMPDGLPVARTKEIEEQPTLTTKPYSPIKDYLKKGK